LLADFEHDRNLRSKTNLDIQEIPRPSVKADFTKDGDFVRVYYVSDGKNVSLITYLSEISNPYLARELTAADAIARSLEF